MTRLPRLVVSMLACLVFGVPPTYAAMDFDGVDDFAQGDVISTFYSATDLTVMAWFTGAGTSPVGASFCHDTESQAAVGNSGASVRAHLLRRSSTVVCATHHDGSQDTLAATHTDGTPVHLALVHTGGNILLYAQGVLASGPTASGNTTTLLPSLLVGGATSLNAFFQGRVDMVATYNVAVSAEEIAAIAGSKRTRIRKTHPTGLWLFDNCADGASGDGVLARDHSGNGEPLTIDNGANNTGATCRASAQLGRWGGIQ